MRGRSRDERSHRRRIRRRSRSDSDSSNGDQDSSTDGRATTHRSPHSLSDTDDHDDTTAVTVVPVNDGEALSFEHLEAIRGVALLTRNEYPLGHLPREKLFKPDDAYAECGCPFPLGNDEGNEDEKARCEDVSCLNFATYIECSASRCDAGKYCKNQRLQHPERFPELEAFKTMNKGYGVRARVEIAQDTVIGEYVGEIIDEKELQRRLKGVPRHELNFYYLALEPGVYIDARNKGSFTRFMNHSCEPNCKTEKWTVKGETRIAVVAQRAIQEKEELTFDYQWKSLGSMQIKCYCGSANCKGVIGTEVDANKTVVDNGPRGFYRDPTKDEVGDALVGRHLRLFVSPPDTSVYTIATVKSYNPLDGSYELEYGDSVGTPQDATFDSPLSAIDDIRSQPFVKLDEHSWQLFVELSGLSDDQLEEAVFAIPKRRTSGPAVVESDSPRKIDPATATTSPSQSSSTPSSTPGPGPAIISQDTPPSQEERRDQDGELLDADGDIVTNKLLVKGLPPKCDEALLRRLFMAPRNARSSSLLEKLQASVVSQRPSDAIVVRLDFFFFDDTSGWALVEFSDSSYPKYFRKNLNSRAFFGHALRVFLAGRREVDSFERAKRNNAIHREERRVSEVTSGAVVNTITPTSEPKVAIPYPYGRALDWLVSIERAEDSPSRRKGTSAALEEKMRSQYVQLIIDVSKNLRFEREDASSAILALHRYFTFCPMQNVEFMAAGILHIYLKAHGRKFSWPDFVSEVYAAKYPTAARGAKVPSAKLNPESELYKRCERQILETEMDLLEGLLFDLSSEDTYGLMDLLTSASKNRKKCDVLPVVDNLQLVPQDVQKEAKHLMSAVLRLPVWAHTPVECVVLSILYVGAAVTGALVYAGTNEPFVTCMTPQFLPWLNPVESEKDALALLDCSLFIVDSLKDRWLRLEKNAKAPRLALDTDPNFFDTERFAVQRHKPVEITQRITMLLKAWIDVKTSHKGQGMVDVASNMALMTLDDLKRRRRTGSFNIVESDATKQTIKASDVLKREATTKGAQGQLRMPPRLHVCDIENAEQIRKRTFLGKVSASVEGIDVAGKPVFLLPWPYREHEPVYSEQMGASRACVRELSTSLIMTARAPQLFIGLAGIVFPNPTSSTEDFGMDVDVSESNRATQLRKTGHYCAYEQPLHMYTGLIDAKVHVPMPLRKKAIYDMLRALALCHEWGYVHRYVAPCNLFVFRDGVRLGGYHAMRKLSLKSNKSDTGRHEMTDNERKEHCHGSWLQVTPPEVLLGDRVFSTRGDVWSAGCVALMLLFDRIPLLQGVDQKAQVNLIFRLCGTPETVWADGKKLPQYDALKPKHEYRMRLRKTLQEHRHDKNLPVPTEAIDVLEAMLQLDPSKRSSAKKLLEMEYFAEFRTRDAPAVDFSSLPSTFDALRLKLEQQLKKASSSSASASKRRRVSSDYERPDSASSADSGKSRRHSGSVSVSRRTSSATEDDTGHAPDQDEEFVPLPDHFHDTVMADATNGSARNENEPANKKRAKLGWGMGLNS